MEADKENVNKAIPGIPLSVEPLPSLPKHLVKSRNMVSKPEIQNERHPLKTINTGIQPQFSLPGSSKNVNNIKQNNSLLLDTRFVTVRSRDGLPWSCDVFKDDVRNDGVIEISDDENKEKVVKIEAKKRKTSEVQTAVTPASLSTLEPNRVKKIKRSLKRPHSRELQGLSPVDDAQKKDEEKVRRKLFFTDSTLDKLGLPDFWEKAYTKSICQDYSCDVFAHLLASEVKIPIPNVSSASRACVINWLMKVNGGNGNPGIVQAACWYFDYLQTTGQVNVDQFQLVGAACYWIATKLLGPCLHSQRLIKYSNNAFTMKELLFAEAIILERLKFPRQPIVPHDFITYLSWWCDSDRPGEIEVAATFLCMCGVMAEKRLSNEYPSVIAAAAVKNAVVLLRKADQLARLVICPTFLAAEKKAENLGHTCALLRRAARAVACEANVYRVPLEFYGAPPHYIAQRILTTGN